MRYGSVIHTKLISLTSDVAHDHVTCDTAEDIGHQIQEKSDDLPYSQLAAKRQDKIKTLAHVCN